MEGMVGLSPCLGFGDRAGWQVVPGLDALSLADGPDKNACSRRREIRQDDLVKMIIAPTQTARGTVWGLSLLCSLLVMTRAVGQSEVNKGSDSTLEELQKDVDLERFRLTLLERHRAALDPQPASREVREAPALRIYTSTATWCSSCKKELPQLQLLRERFQPSEVGLFGVPVDPKDDADKVQAYREKYQPAYQLLNALTQQDTMLLRRVIYKVLRVDGLPASVVTDAEGRVLLVTAQVPTYSEVRKLLVTLQ
jgi:thiol-disulfide isomerase/thioredoxin